MPEPVTVGSEKPKELKVPLCSGLCRSNRLAVQARYVVEQRFTLFPTRSAARRKLDKGKAAATSRAHQQSSPSAGRFSKLTGSSAR